MTSKKGMFTLLFATLLISCIAGCSTLSQAVSTGTMGNTVTGSTNYSGATQEVGTGSSSYTVAANTVRTNSIVASQDGTIISIGVRVRTASGNIMLAIYDDDGGVPGALLGYTTSTAAVTGWMDLELNNPVDVVAGNTYWLAHLASSASLRLYRPTTGTSYTVSQTYGSFPDPFGSTSTANYIVNYRMTYSGTPAGFAYATQVMLDSSIASVQSISFYSSAKGFLRLALYTNNGETSGPGDLLWQSSSDAVAVGWDTVPVAAGEPATVQNLVPGTYWLAFQWGSSSAGPNMITGDVGTGYSMAMGYGAFPSVWDGGGSSDTQWSIYAAYNVLGTVTPAPTPRAAGAEGASEDTTTPETTAAPTAPPVVTPVPPDASSYTGTVTATRSSDNAVFDVLVAGNVAASQISGLTITPDEVAQTTKVAFTISGDSGSSGSLTMTIPKAAIAYGTEPIVYIDGTQAQDQSYTVDGQNYYVTYTAHFSTHDVSIVFAAGSGGGAYGVD
jgi:hypothetical protein